MTSFSMPRRSIFPLLVDEMVAISRLSFTSPSSTELAQLRADFQLNLAEAQSTCLSFYGSLATSLSDIMNGNM